MSCFHHFNIIRPFFFDHAVADVEVGKEGIALRAAAAHYVQFGKFNEVFNVYAIKTRLNFHNRIDDALAFLVFQFIFNPGRNAPRLVIIEHSDAGGDKKKRYNDFKRGFQMSGWLAVTFKRCLILFAL